MVSLEICLLSGIHDFLPRASVETSLGNYLISILLIKYILYRYINIAL